MLPVDCLEQLQTVDARHPEIRDHRSGTRHGKGRQRRLAAVGGADTIAGRSEPQADQLEQVGIIVDQQYLAGLHGRCVGRRYQ